MKSAPLPTRNGISPSYIWLPEGRWQNALDFLCSHFPEVDEQTWLGRFSKQEIRTAEGEILTPSSTVKRGMCLYYYREVENETSIPFQETLLFQNEDLLVVDKPHFLPVTPGGNYLKETLLVRLKNSTGIDFLTPLHRLDRETAGVILFSCNPRTRGRYQALFQQNCMEKTYHAIAAFLPNLPSPYLKRSRLEESSQFFVMREVDGEANSETLISVIERRGDHALYRLQPKTGKKHQLRVHLASLGAPILNDRFYPQALPAGNDDFERPLKLLAKSISFTDPHSQEHHQFESQLSL